MLAYLQLFQSTGCENRLSYPIYIRRIKTRCFHWTIYRSVIHCHVVSGSLELQCCYRRIYLISRHCPIGQSWWNATSLSVSKTIHRTVTTLLKHHMKWYSMIEASTFSETYFDTLWPKAWALTELLCMCNIFSQVLCFAIHKRFIEWIIDNAFTPQLFAHYFWI